MLHELLNNMEQSRTEQIPEYGCLRFIATLLVVLGHCTYYKISTNYGGCDYSAFVGNGCTMLFLFQKITMLLYLFHMPLFMTLSGALFWKSNKHKKYHNIKTILIDKGRRLLLPFLIVSICYSFPLKLLSGYYYQSVNLVKDFFIGQLLLQGNTHLWYCVTLFFIFLIVYLIENNLRIRGGIKVVIVICLCILSPSIHIRLLSYIFEFMFWFYLGFYFESVRTKINIFINNRMIFLNTTLLCIIYYFYHLLYGRDHFLFKILLNIMGIILAMICCLIIYIIAFKLSKTKVVELLLYKVIEKDSFGIYLYSDTWNYIMLSAGTSMFGRYLFTENLITVAFYGTRFFGTLIISIIMTELLRKCNLRYLY